MVWRRTLRATLRRAPNVAVLALLTVFALGPIVVLGFNSLKERGEIARNPLGPPQTVTFENFPRAWDVGNYSTTLRNSAVLVLGTVAGILSLGSMAAYSMARLRLPGEGFVTLYLLVTASLPIQLFLVPLFYMWRNLGLVNNLFGLILIYIAIFSPFAIFLMRSYMLNLPGDFEDAARIDGANEWQVYTRIVLPLCWPSLLTVGLVVALTVWNEFLLATVFLTDSSLFTVVTSYYNFSGRFGRDWALTSAGAVMMILPIIVLFLAFQRRFIAGLTRGGLTG